MKTEICSASMLLNFGKAKTEPIALFEFIQWHDVMIIQVPKPQPKRRSSRWVTNSIHSLWVCKHLRGWVDHQQLELIDRGISMIWWTCGKSMLGHNVGQVVRLVWSRHAMFSDDLNFQAISYRCVWICVDHNCKTQLEQVWEVSRQQARRHTAAMPIKKQRVCSY